MFIKRLSKLFICVILIFLLFEKSNAYYMKKGGTPYYIQLVRPILKRQFTSPLPPEPPTESKNVFSNVCSTNDSNTVCEPQQKSKKGESTIYERKNQFDDCRVNDDDCHEYSYETNKRPVEVGNLDKKILEVLFNMKLLDTDMNQEMSDQRLRK